MSGYFVEDNKIYWQFVLAFFVLYFYEFLYVNIFIHFFCFIICFPCRFHEIFCWRRV